MTSAATPQALARMTASAERLQRAGLVASHGRMEIAITLEPDGRSARLALGYDGADTHYLTHIEGRHSRPQLDFLATVLEQLARIDTREGAA